MEDGSEAFTRVGEAGDVLTEQTLKEAIDKLARAPAVIDLGKLADRVDSLEKWTMAYRSGSVSLRMMLDALGIDGGEDEREYLGGVYNRSGEAIGHRAVVVDEDGSPHEFVVQDRPELMDRHTAPGDGAYWADAEMLQGEWERQRLVSDALARARAQVRGIELERQARHTLQGQSADQVVVDAPMVDPSGAWIPRAWTQLDPRKVSYELGHDGQVTDAWTQEYGASAPPDGFGPSGPVDNGGAAP